MNQLLHLDSSRVSGNIRLDLRAKGRIAVTCPAALKPPGARPCDGADVVRTT